MSWLESKFELSRSGSRNNVRSMEGLRGFAIFLVFITHYYTIAGFWLPKQSWGEAIGEGIHHIGVSGVDLFFVLSGYLIYGSLISREQNFFVFMRRRVQRIYPVFVVVLAVYIALSFVFSSENKIPSPFIYGGLIYIAQNLLLLPGIVDVEPIIAVAWSLTYEMLYYLMIPMVIWVCGIRSWKPSQRMLFFCVISVLWLACYPVTAVHIRLVMFLAGILLYEIENNTSISAPSSAMTLALMVSAYALMTVAIPISAGLSIKALALYITYFSLCFTCFSGEGSILGNFFSWRPIRWLGNMSYSYYLIHGLTLKAMFLVISKVPVLYAMRSQEIYWGFLPIAFAITLIPAAFMFLLVERPLSLVVKRPMLPVSKG